MVHPCCYRKPAHLQSSTGFISTSKGRYCVYNVHVYMWCLLAMAKGAFTQDASSSVIDAWHVVLILAWHWLGDKMLYGAMLTNISKLLRHCQSWVDESVWLLGIFHITDTSYMYHVSVMFYFLNALWSSDTIWRRRSESTLAQVMACCLTAPSHYLNQCWLIISKV